MQDLQGMIDSHDTGYVNNTSLCLHKVRHTKLRQLTHRSDIDVHNVVKLLHWGRFDCTIINNASAVHQNVQTTELLDGCIDNPFNVRIDGHVSSDKKRTHIG